MSTLETMRAASALARVTLTSAELTSLCPVTRQPDFNTLVIEYCHDELLIESKSLKEYIGSFRDVEIFCEDMAGRILADVVCAIGPKWCKVTVHQNVRGGIEIEADAEWRRAGDI